MSLKKLIIIGSISVVAITAAIVIPITIVKSKKKSQQAQNNTHQPTEADIIDDDKLGPEMQSALDSCFLTYRNEAESSSSIALKPKEEIYVCNVEGLTNTSQNDKFYCWNMNDAVWEVYSSDAKDVTPVVNPEQAFGGYYVYY